MSFKYILRYGGKNPHFTQILHIWFDHLGFPPPSGKANWEALGGTFTLETKGDGYSSSAKIWNYSETAEKIW